MKSIGGELSAAEIYRRALERIANLNCASCERYVAEADAIAVEALILAENINEAVVESDVVPCPGARAA